MPHSECRGLLYYRRRKINEDKKFNRELHNWMGIFCRFPAFNGSTATWKGVLILAASREGNLPRHQIRQVPARFGYSLEMISRVYLSIELKIVICSAQPRIIRCEWTGNPPLRPTPGSSCGTPVGLWPGNWTTPEQ